MSWAVAFLTAPVWAFAESVQASYPFILSDASLFYDFGGTGSVGTLLFAPSVNGGVDGWYQTEGAAVSFARRDLILSNDNDLIYGLFWEDINRDGRLDLSFNSSGGQFQGKGYFDASLSSPSGYVKQRDLLLLPSLDLNQDGRLDYLTYDQTTQSWSVQLQQADGSFVAERMQTMSKAQYEQTFDPSAWGSTEVPPFTGLSSFGGGMPNTAFSGASLAKAPRKARGMNAKVTAPTKALDLNQDGLLDLVDEGSGTLYYNMGAGKWIVSQAGGAVIAADLNGDGVQDFVFPGAKLQTVVYTGGGEFETTVLYENIQVDKQAYCYDFDRDGDIDILVTFSACKNATGYAYTLFFRNDGTGHFTQASEQDYGERRLYFADLQDLDGDGYYDLLAFDNPRDVLYNTYDRVYYLDSLPVYWLRGQADLSFAEPAHLYSVYSKRIYGYHSDNGQRYEDTLHNSLYAEFETLRLNAEDLDRDGRMEIWTSGIRGAAAAWGDTNEGTRVFTMPTLTPNAPPTMPSAPQVRYENGLLLITWADGQDDHTAPLDLTYALKVGTSSGGDDIVKAHANADGSRRNFLDGNMGHEHAYRLDLRSYAPATIYVSVQAIDAQHLGSAWSEEASVAHTMPPASFRVGEGNRMDGYALHYLLPEGYTQRWTVTNGRVQGDTLVFFDQVGRQTVTRMVSAPSGQTAMQSVEVNVTPCWITRQQSLDKAQASVLTDLNRAWMLDITMHPRADYNLDGNFDGAFSNAIYKGGADMALTKATGLWNTGLQFEDPYSTYFWYDYTHNGAIDFVACGNNQADSYAPFYLPHNGTNNLMSKRTDNALSTYVNRTTYTGSNAIPTVNLFQRADLTHNGYYEVFSAQNITTNQALLVRQADGSFATLPITGSADPNLLFAALGNDNSTRFLIDFDQDGFTDACCLHYYESPYNDLAVMLNKGNGQFEQLIVPFAQSFSSQATGGCDMQNAHLVDLNQDGYLDLVANRSTDGAIYILWNDHNTAYSAPEILPLGDLDAFLQHTVWWQGYDSNTLDPWVAVADMDNNGYLDIVSLQLNKAAGDRTVGIYVHYRNAEGVLAQGFLIPEFATVDGTYGFNTRAQIVHLPEGIAIAANPGEGNNGVFYFVQGAPNARPDAPTSVQALQTDEGLLIEWVPSSDDHTPACLMRYNLSVKKKGATGNGAYLISPQNGGRAEAAYLPDYDYLTATRFLIPTAYLETTEYEIQVQAMDAMCAMSLFSTPVTVKVLPQVVLQAPAQICQQTAATVTYTGTRGAQTPVWDWDGGTVLSGSGYGPYAVQWDSVGVKTIALTLGEERSERSIRVEAVAVDYALPTAYFNHGRTPLHWPQGYTYEWAAKYVTDAQFKPLSAWQGILSVQGDELFLDKPTGTALLVLQLTLTNALGCTQAFETTLTLLLEPQDNPSITLVTGDENGHNVVSWEPNLVYDSVYVQKETNRRGQFITVGTVPMSAGLYADLTSSTSTKAERYRLMGMRSDGIVSPASDIHQTVHLVINRGLTEQTYNLIWNPYKGADIVSYNILRGSDPAQMSLLASVSSETLSYTDLAPDATTPLYAIEYVLNEPVPASVKGRRLASLAGRNGRSNVANLNTAYSIVPAEAVTIYSVNGAYETSATQPMLVLYAEVSPASATYQSVYWSIAEGNDLATIDENGVLTACSPNAGGTVTVVATAKDGSGKTATRLITIAPIGSVTPPQPPQPVTDYMPFDLRATVTDNAYVTFTWSAETPAPYYQLQVDNLTTGETVVSSLVQPPYSDSLEGKTGIFEWYVRALDNDLNDLSAWVTGAQFELRASTAVENVSDPTLPRKVYWQGHVYIWRNGALYTPTGLRVK